jgi:hypothetical protein
MADDIEFALEALTSRPDIGEALAPHRSARGMTTTETTLKTWSGCGFCFANSRPVWIGTP